jgi:hypothetical protein
MKIYLTLPTAKQVCSECLTPNTLLFTVETKTDKITLCEGCAKEAVNGIIKAGIEARKTHIAHGKP